MKCNLYEITSGSCHNPALYSTTHPGTAQYTLLSVCSWRDKSLDHDCALIHKNKSEILNMMHLVKHFTFQECRI